MKLKILFLFLMLFVLFENLFAYSNIKSEQRWTATISSNNVSVKNIKKIPVIKPESAEISSNRRIKKSINRRNK